jgi:hypothetical protein
MNLQDLNACLIGKFISIAVLDDEWVGEVIAVLKVEEEEAPMMALAAIRFKDGTVRLSRIEIEDTYFYPDAKACQENS